MDEESLRDAFEKVLTEFGVELDPIAESKEEREEWADYSEIISKTQDKLDDLNEKSESLLEKTGMTREQLEAYVSNRANFTQQQWDSLQELKRQTTDFKAKAQEVTDVAVKRKEKGKKKQGHRFGKKKHWIPL